MDFVTALKAKVDDFGNMTNFGRHLASRNPEWFDRVITETPWLDASTSFNERVYHLVHDMTSRPLCPLSDIELKFINFTEGYPKHRMVKASQVLATTPVTNADIVWIKAHPSPLDMLTGRFMTEEPALYRRIMASPRDFGDAGFSERLYAIINDIEKRPDHGYSCFSKGYGSGIRKSVADAEVIPLAQKIGRDDAATGYAVKRYIDRNRSRNARLYDLPDDREGIDYLTCPLLGERMLNIKKPYVEGILMMSWDAFRERFPEQKLTCKGHTSVISHGLSMEDASGISRHAASVKKATVSRAVVGEDGLTVNQRKGRKTRDALMQRDADGISGYQKIAEVARPKQVETLAAEHKRAKKEHASEWKAYRYFVDWLSRRHKNELLDGKPTGRMGAIGAFQIDHVFPVLKGFHLGISPWVIASRSNLEAVPWKVNSDRRTNHDHNLGQLLSSSGYTADLSKQEFQQFMEIYNEGVRGSISLLKRYNERFDPKLY